MDQLGHVRLIKKRLPDRCADPRLEPVYQEITIPVKDPAYAYYKLGMGYYNWPRQRPTLRPHSGGVAGILGRERAERPAPQGRQRKG